jgi:hypothetical protein
VVYATDSTFDQAPEALDRVGVDIADHVHSRRVLDPAMIVAIPHVLDGHRRLSRDKPGTGLRIWITIKSSVTWKYRIRTPAARIRKIRTRGSIGESGLMGVQMDRKYRDWSAVMGDAFWLLILFALWLWQFETSAQASLYHSVLAAIGFVCLVGVGVLVAAMLAGAVLSRFAR